MPLDLTAFDAALKINYGPALIKLLNDNVKLWKLFHKNGDTSLAVDGKNVQYPIHYGRNIGVGAVGENKTLPVAGNQTTAGVTIPYRYTYGRIQLTTQTIKQSKTSKGAFKKAMELETQGLITDMKRLINRYLWGFGAGILCKVNGQQASGTTINVKDAHGVSNSVAGARLVQTSEVVAFLRNATPSSVTDSDIVASSVHPAVSSIASDFSSITFDEATGATLNDGDLIILAPGDADSESSAGKEPMGLLGIVDDSTYLGTLHGVARSTVGKYKATKIAANGNLNFNLLQRAEDLTDERGGSVSVLYSHHSVRREYLKLLIAAKRFVGGDVAAPDAGFAQSAIGKAVEWNGKPWEVERMCPFGMIFGLDKSKLTRYVNCEGEWADEDGSVLGRILNKDAYEARYRIFDNYHSDMPCANFRIDNVTLTEPLDVTAAE